MRSSMPQPEEDIRDPGIDPVMLSTAGRFAQFPRMVDALGSPDNVAVPTPDLRQRRGLAGDDMFAPATRNTAARRRPSAPARPEPRYDRRERRWTNDEPVQMQQRDPQDEWDSHIASVVQRRSQGTQSPPAMAERALRTRRRSAPPPPPYRDQPRYPPTRLRSTRYPLPEPKPAQPTPRQPYADSWQSIERAPLSQQRQQLEPLRQQRQHRRLVSTTPNELISDANMYLPGQRSGTVILDTDNSSTSTAFWAEQPQWPQAYTTPGPGWQRAPEYDPDPPPQPPNASPPTPQQLPLAARYTVNDNDVFVYASCDIRDSPKYRRARLLEATATAASLRRNAGSAEADSLAARSLAAHSDPLAVALPASAGLMHAGSRATAPVDAGHSERFPLAEASENALEASERASSEPGGAGMAAAGDSVWAKLLQKPSEPKQEAAQDAAPQPGASVAGPAVRPSGIWADMLTLEGDTACRSPAGERSEGGSAAVRSAASAAVVVGAAAGAAVAATSDSTAGVVVGAPGSAAGLSGDASASTASAEEALAGPQYESDSATDDEPAATEVDVAAAAASAEAASAAHSTRTVEADDVNSAGFQCVDGEVGVRAAGAAAQFVHEAASDAQAGILPRGSEAASGSGREQEDAEGAGPGARPDDVLGREQWVERPSATVVGLPPVAMYAGVGPAGTALFFDPEHRGAWPGGEERRGTGGGPPVRSPATAAVPSYLPDAPGAEVIPEQLPTEAGGGDDGGEGGRWGPAVEGGWDSQRAREQGGPMAAWEAGGGAAEFLGAGRAAGAAGEGMPAAAALPADETAIVLATPTVEAPDVAQGCVLPDMWSGARCSGGCGLLVHGPSRHPCWLCAPCDIMCTTIAACRDICALGQETDDKWLVMAPCSGGVGLGQSCPSGRSVCCMASRWRRCEGSRCVEGLIFRPC